MMTDSRLSQAAGAAPLPVASGDPAAAALRCFLSCSFFRRFVHLQSHFFFTCILCICIYTFMPHGLVFILIGAMSLFLSSLYCPLIHSISALTMFVAKS